MRFSRAFGFLWVTCALGAVLHAQTIQINRENKTIAISTTDEATETADIAAINVGFEVFGPDSQGTYADAGKLSQAILAALHNIGVKDDGIESSNQGLQANTDFGDKDSSELRAKSDSYSGSRGRLACLRRWRLR